MENDWIGDLRRLHAQGSVFVEHNPKTPRYWRAETAVRRIIQTGEVIGLCKATKLEPIFASDEDIDEVFHVVVWAHHEDAEFFGAEPGYYAVFRIGFGRLDDEMIAEFAELFCFYDGQDPNRGDPKNPRLFSKDEAISYMQTFHGDYEVIP